MVFIASIHAQWDETEQFPPGLRWKQIVLPGYRLIFPEEITADARRVARLLETLSPSLGWSLMAEQQPISLILNNQTLMANGYVALAPRKTEWFTTPPQAAFSGPVEWYRLLAVHEGRHVLQFDKLNQGAFRLVGKLFGEQGLAAVMFLCVPTWVFEGDAVAAETGLTPYGRGRMPEFDMAARAHILAGQRFSYAKAYLGSYRDVYLDPYSLGYLMIAYGRRQYGADFWGRVLDRTGDNADYLVYAFDRALKKTVGRNASAFYREVVDFLGWQWRRHQEELIITPFTPIRIPRRAAWTNYSGAQYESEGTLLAVKYGLADAPAIVRLHRDGREEVVRRFAPMEIGAARISLGAGKIVWSERVPDLRWGKRDFSAIVVHELQKKRTRCLLARSRLLNPAISPDGRRIAAVEYTRKNRCSLVLISAADGQELARFANPENDLLLSPNWSEDGRRIALVRQSSAGAALAVIETGSGLRCDIIPCGGEAVSQPVFFGKYVLFSSPYSGIDNIYAVDTESGRRFQVTSLPLGAFFPAVDPGGKKMVFANYTPEGFVLAETDLVPSAWMPGEVGKKPDIGFYQPLALQEQGGMIAQATTRTEGSFREEAYAPGRHLVRIHSWGLSRTDNGIGLHLLSNDVMNLFLWQAVGEYDSWERVLRIGAAGSYRGLFPIIDLSLHYGGRRAETVFPSGDTEEEFFREADFKLGLRVPLDLTRGIYTTGIEAGAALNVVHVSGRSDRAQNGWHLPLAYRFSFYRLRMGSRRDIVPPYGQDLTLVFRHTPRSGAGFSSQFFAQASFFFPGLFRHHSLRIRAYVQQLQAGPYPFANLAAIPRGYNWEFQKKIFGLAGDYLLPLAYPDWAAGDVFYLKRLRAGFFLDHARARNGLPKTIYSSAGLEFLADCHLFNLVLPLEIGARLVYRFQDRSWRMEPLVFSLSF